MKRALSDHPDPTRPDQGAFLATGEQTLKIALFYKKGTFGQKKGTFGHKGGVYPLDLPMD
jgi:hypothetical protein